MGLPGDHGERRDCSTIFERTFVRRAVAQVVTLIARRCVWVAHIDRWTVWRQRNRLCRPAIVLQGAEQLPRTGGEPRWLLPLALLSLGLAVTIRRWGATTGT